MKIYFRYIFISFLILAVSPDLIAQKSLMKKATRLYYSKAYAEAIPFYKQVLKRDSTNPDALINIADCFRLTNNIKETKYYYEKVVALAAAELIHTFYYAEALMETGDYETAKKYMSEYRDDERGKIFAQAITKLNTFYKDTAYYRIEKATFNSNLNDFSPVIYKDSVVFASARYRWQLIKYVHSWTDRKYYALYYTYKDDSGRYIHPKVFARNILIRYNTGPICFANDNNTIYITRNNIKKGRAIRSSDGEIKLNLYQATYNENKKRFEDVKGFDFNSNDYNTAHPAISPDGDRLYFSSDMPGGYGGMDLWVCDKEGDTWSPPVNLGKNVNSYGDDLFPFVYDKNTLYYSSNGLEGIGGLDIFSVKLKDDGMSAEKAKNIGAPLNSPADDFGIVFNADGKSGFFSSNRESFDIDDNIYEFTVSKPEKQPYVILVKDSATKQLLDAGITLINDETGEKVDMKEKGGKFTIDLFPDKTYTLSANSEGYSPKANIKYTSSPDNTKPFEILLAKIVVEKYFIAGTVYERFEDSSSKPLDSARIIISETGGNYVCSPYVTDLSGKYHSCDLKPNTSYTVTVMRDGYFSKSSEVPSIPPGGAIRDFYLSKIVIGKAIKIENIYFDLGKWNIRPDAAKELDKIVTLMQENPAIIIELSSHTDCRSSYQFNMDLSDKRAKASAAYIVSKGIHPSRITGKGYGESQLVNDCKCEGAIKSNCTEEEHQQNRRTEFKVTGFVKGMGNVNIKTDK
jgi:outer membrane protein OmpA-like peptidoglycan-associated protein/tetratricopeptide (TPR) repeat protein